MQPLLFLAQDHDPGHGGSHPTHINPLDAADPANLKAALWALGIFVVVLLLLRKMAWGPIIQGLQSREDRINASLKRAEELEKATRELAETNRQAMAKAQQEAQAIVSEARTAAQKAAADIAAKAHAEIEASRDRFQREMRLEADKVRDELRRETVNLTLQATALLLGRTMSAADHQRLAQDALRDAESVASPESSAAARN